MIEIFASLTKTYGRWFKVEKQSKVVDKNNLIFLGSSVGRAHDC